MFQNKQYHTHLNVRKDKGPECSVLNLFPRMRLLKRISSTVDQVVWSWASTQYWLPGAQSTTATETHSVSPIADLTVT